MQKYNTSLPNIKLPEYGRNIEKLVQYCKSIPDREKRTRYAYQIVSIMADVYPDIVQVENHQQILWDHLAIMANFELDIDFPYPVTTVETLRSQPDAIPYNDPYIASKMYGKTIENLIEKACAIEDRDQRIRMFELCANHMKRQFLATNKSAEEDDNKIIQDLLYYTKGEFQEDIYQVFLFSAKELALNNQYDPKSLTPPTGKKKKKKKK